MRTTGLTIGFLAFFAVHLGTAAVAKADSPPNDGYINQYLKSALGPNAKISSIDLYRKDYDALVRHLDKRRKRLGSELDLIEVAVRKVQAMFLQDYKQYVGFEGTLSRQQYDCVTATALFASVFDDLGISHEIWETNYHTYIKFHLLDETVGLLETTRGGDAILVGKEAIQIEAEFLQENQEGFLFEYGIQIHRQVSAEELTGLLVFNQAVKAYNEGLLLRAGRLVRNAEQYYPSERVDLLKQIIRESFAMVASSSQE